MVTVGDAITRRRARLDRDELAGNRAKATGVLKESTARLVHLDAS